MQQNLQLRWCLKCVCFSLLSFCHDNLFFFCCCCWLLLLFADSTDTPKYNNNINSMALCALHCQWDDESKGVSSRCTVWCHELFLLSNNQQKHLIKQAMPFFVLNFFKFHFACYSKVCSKKKQQKMHTRWNLKKLNRRSLTKWKKERF